MKYNSIEKKSRDLKKKKADFFEIFKIYQNSESFDEFRMNRCLAGLKEKSGLDAFNVYYSLKEFGLFRTVVRFGWPIIAVMLLISTSCAVMTSSWMIFLMISLIEMPFAVPLLKRIVESDKIRLLKHLEELKYLEEESKESEQKAWIDTYFKQ